jgi:anthranilate phosphoribosyltransferase
MVQRPGPFPWGRVITGLLAGESLTEEDAAAAMVEVMEGAATPAQIAGFVIALRAKGETTDEIVGLVKTMRKYSAPVRVTGDLLDTCGTGGDRAGTFNVSTAAAIVCAAAGARVAKHGNRAASSRAGSADVLETLGVTIDLAPAGVERCIEEVGIGFCFAPIFHPAMRHAATPRRELGVATIFNFLGPLTNPAGATLQALGVSDPKMIDKMVETLARLGSKRVIAFRGRDGLDELSTSGPSDVVELDASGEVKRWVIDPTELGLRRAERSEVAGGSSEDNAAIIRAVFEGNTGAPRDIVILNAAAGLVAAGISPDMEAGLTKAGEAIDSGGATTTLEGLIEVSGSAGDRGE